MPSRINATFSMHTSFSPSGESWTDPQTVVEQRIERARPVPQPPQSLPNVVVIENHVQFLADQISINLRPILTFKTLLNCCLTRVKHELMALSRC